MLLFVNWLFLVGTSSLCFLERVFDGDNKLTSSFRGRFCDLVVVLLVVPALVVVDLSPNKKVSYPGQVLGMIEKLVVVLVVVTLSIVQLSIMLWVDKGLIICLIFASPIQLHPIVLSVVWTFADILLGCLCLLYNCSFILEQLVCSHFDHIQVDLWIMGF